MTPEQEAEAYALRSSPDWYDWRTNEHGVRMTTLGSGHGRGEFPEVCVGCPLLDWDGDEDGWWSAYFCTKYVILPTRKGTCRVREKEEALG